MNPLRRVHLGPRSEIESLVAQEIDTFQRARLIGIWRSPLERAIRRSGPKRARSPEWKRFIGNLLTTGVSQDEIDISGILKMLEWDDPDRYIEYEEILDYIDEAGLKIHVMQERGWTLARPWFAVGADEDPGRYQTNFRTDERYRSRYGFQVERAGLFDPERLHGRWVARYRRPESDEVSLALSCEDPASAVEWCHGVAWRQGITGPGRLGRFPDEALTGGRNYREILFVIPNAWPPFDHCHFPVQNVLCHLRLVERLSDDGSRFLHIEEIQSDWHNSRRHPLRAPLKKQWVKIALSWCLQEALERGLAGVSVSGADILLNRNGEARAPGLREFYRNVEKTLLSLASAAGGTRAQAVYRCHEPNISVRELFDGWALSSRRPEVLIRGIRSAREAGDIQREWLPDQSIRVTAARFNDKPANNWAVPYFRLDPDARPATQPTTDITARGREALALLDRIENEVFDALVGLGCQYFGSITECMFRVKHQLDDQEVLPDEIVDDFYSFAEEICQKKRNWRDRRPVGDALQWMRKSIVALKDAIREHGDLPPDWSAVRPRRPGLSAITDTPDSKDQAISTGGGKREQGADNEV